MQFEFPPPSGELCGSHANMDSASFGRRDLWALLVLTGLSTLIYAQTWRFEFLTWDDMSYVINQYQVIKGLRWEGVWWAFTTLTMANWHPLTWLSYQLDVSLFGDWAGGFHLVNIGWHAANAALLFWFFRRATGAFWRSALVAALFVVHPLHVESVAWISERKDVLSAFFWLLAMLCYVRYVRQPNWRTWGGVSVAVALSLMAKPMAITLPFALLLLDVWPLRRWSFERSWSEQWPMTRALLLEKLPWLVMALAVTAATVIAQQKAMFAGLDVADRFTVSVVAYGNYLWQTFVPVGLSYFYVFESIWSTPKFVASFLLLLVVTLAGWHFRRSYPYLLTGWLWFLGTLVPVIGIVKVGSQAFADRYVYLPHIGLFWLLVWGAAALLAQWPRHRKWAATAAVAMLAVLTVLSWRQTTAWRTSETLFRAAIAHDERNYTAMAGLALILGAQGRHPEAVVFAQRAAELSPGAEIVRIAHQTVAMVSVVRGDYAEAQRQFQKSIDAAPDVAVGYLGLAWAMVKQGARADAEVALRKAIELEPTYSEAYNNLGALLDEQGRSDESLQMHERAVEYDKTNVAAKINLAHRLEQRGRLQAARDLLLAAREINPRNPVLERDIARVDEAMRRASSAR